MSPPTISEIRLIAKVGFAALCDETERRQVPEDHAISTMIVAMACMVGAYAATVSVLTGKSAEEVIGDIAEGARLAVDAAKDLMPTGAQGTVQ